MPHMHYHNVINQKKPPACAKEKDVLSAENTNTQADRHTGKQVNTHTHTHTHMHTRTHTHLHTHTQSRKHTYTHTHTHTHTQPQIPQAVVRCS